MNNITFEIIGERIKRRREELNMSQEDISKELKKQGIDISRVAISKIENGARMINAIELEGFAKVLQVDVKTLLEDEQSEELMTLFRTQNIDDEMLLEDIGRLQTIFANFIDQMKLYMQK